MEITYEDEFLRISARQKTNNNASDSILLSFTGVGHGMGEIDVQKPEFFGSGRVFDNVIFITDKTRSWGNSLNFNTLAEKIAPFIENKDVYSIGNSMGGFLSIVATHYLPIKKSISFAPQYSVNPIDVPWEHRWKSYTDKIYNYSIKNAGSHMNDRTAYFVLSGSKKNDKKHALLFSVKPNVFHYSFPKTGHNVAASLKEGGLLDRVIQSCFNDSDRLDVDIEYKQLSPAP